jgi:serine/threonine protein kinase
MTLKIPSGKYSFFLKNDYFKNFFESPEDNYLLRITNKNYFHDDYEITKKIYHDVHNVNFYILPELEEFRIDTNDKFFKYLIDLNLDKYCSEILKKENTLFANFIRSFGDMDLFDLLAKVNKNQKTIWNNYTLNKFSNFMKHLSNAVHELHKHNICHFDIKPENIRVDTLSSISEANFGNRFRLIDFGFAEETPFFNYRNFAPGTPGYSTKIIDSSPDDWLPISTPNDWIKITDNKESENNKESNKENKLHIIDSDGFIKTNLTDYENDLIFKSDVYSLGRTFFHTFYFINKLIDKKDKGIKYDILNDIIRNMIKDEVIKRFSTKKMYIRIDML